MAKTRNTLRATRADLANAMASSLNHIDPRTDPKKFQKACEDWASERMIRYERDGRHTYYSEALCRLTGLDQDNYDEGRNERRWYALVKMAVKERTSRLQMDEQAQASQKWLRVRKGT